MSVVIIDKYKELDGAKDGFLGHRFKKDQALAGDMRCQLCGGWFCWDTARIDTYIVERRWDDRRGEPIHCGNTACHDYHMRYLKHIRKLKDDPQYNEDHFVRVQVREHGVDQNAMWSLFQRLKARGIVA